jgi:hypothetical protein
MWVNSVLKNPRGEGVVETVCDAAQAARRPRPEMHSQHVDSCQFRREFGVAVTARMPARRQIVEIIE